MINFEHMITEDLSSMVATMDASIRLSVKLNFSLLVHKTFPCLPGQAEATKRLATHGSSLHAVLML